jgi:choline-sulfatase
MSKKRPHVLLMMSDQHSRKLMGCSGDPVVRTPNLDRLASEGLRFSDAYCPSPLCGPSRMSILTGLLPTRTGVHRNHQALASHIPTIAHALGCAGYHSVLCGRMHFVGPDQRHGFRERLVGDHGPTDEAQREHPFGVFDNTTGQDGRMLHRSGPGRSPVMLYDEAVTEAAVSYLQAYGGDRPLFMTVGFYGPHNPYACPADLFEHYAPQVAFPGAEQRRRFYETAHPAVRRWLETRNLVDVPDETVRRAVAGYYGLVETVDRRIGTVLDAADETLGRDDTIVVYMSDHGDMAGEKGMFWKSNFYEGSVGAPLMWRRPGHVRPGLEDRPVSLLDAAPTLCELCDAPQLPRNDGRSLADVLHAPQPADERAVVSMLADRSLGLSAMARRGRYKLVRHNGFEAPQLFDLQQDPDEQADRGADGELSDVRSRLETLLGEYWNPAEITDAMKGSSESLELMRGWAEQTHAEHLEHWKPDVGKVFLETDE